MLAASERDIKPGLSRCLRECREQNVGRVVDSATAVAVVAGKL